MVLSVRRSVVIWYTVWMVALILIVLAVVLSGGGYIADREAERMLVGRVQEAAGEIELDDGELEIDDDIEFRGDGAYIAIFASDGSRIAGYLPDDAPSPQFADGVLSELSGWHVYDEMRPLGRAGFVWVRGVARNYDEDAFISYANLLILIVLPLMAALSAVGGYFIVRRSFRPLDRMIETAEDIAGGEDLSKRIGLGEGDSEMHKAAAAFDMMLDRIEGSFEKEKQFTSDASHELRTPISVILAECEYAAGHTGEKEEMDEAIAVVSRQAHRMSALVSELLYIARADRKSIRMERGDVDAVELASAVADTMEAKAADRDITLSVESSGPVVAYADHDMLMRVLINLISNAVSYGRDGGHVWVRLRSEGGSAVIEVADDGIGIAEEDLGRIWDRFYQADPARSGERGAGLGLPIVREIVSLHGGVAEAESRAGHGSVFRVIFPRKNEGNA